MSGSFQVRPIAEITDPREVQEMRAYHELSISLFQGQSPALGLRMLQQWEIDPARAYAQARTEALEAGRNPPTLEEALASI